MKRIFTILLSLLLASFLTACGGQTGLQDGYYTAQAAESISAGRNMLRFW